MSTVKRKAKAVMLPTNEATHLFINQGVFFNYHKPQLGNGNTVINYNLYITSDDEIKDKDWCVLFDDFGNVMSNPQQYDKSKGHVLNNGLRKIIATTDKSLSTLVKDSTSIVKYILPQPSQSFIQKFIEAYNSGNPITDVMVEYEGIQWLDRPLEYFPKINLKDNTITISKVKDSWSKEEVEEFTYHILGHFAAKHDIYIDGREISEYLKQNL